jgi:hypothetical protein
LDQIALKGRYLLYPARAVVKYCTASEPARDNSVRLRCSYNWGSLGILIEMNASKAHFIEPMLLLRTEKLPEGEEWIRELKLDGYRSLALVGP